MHQISSFSEANLNSSGLNIINDTSSTNNSKQPFATFQNSLIAGPDGTKILDHFIDKPITYIKLLFLTQQFDYGLELLNKIGDNVSKIHVPHLAIALKEHKLFNIQNDEQNETAMMNMTYGVNNTTLNATANQTILHGANSSKHHYFNYGKNIVNYCYNWQSAHPEFAIHYFYFLNDLPDSNSHGVYNKDSTLFHESVSRLIFDGISDAVFESLFNQNNGSIYKLLSINEANILFSKVGKDCERHGRLEQASKLFEIAGEYNHCVNVLRFEGLDGFLRLFWGLFWSGFWGGFGVDPFKKTKNPPYA